MTQVKPNLEFQGKTQKQNESEKDCQDHYKATKNCFAIADGASQSFYPSIWAKMLVDKFCEDSEINPKNWKTWLAPIQKDWLSEIRERVETAKIENNPVWLTNQNLLNERKPATSTFIGLQFIENENIFKVSIVGDSCLFVWDENSKSLESYLLKKASEFNDRPEYLASYPNDNRYEPEFFDLPLENKESYVILATDALSEWILKNYEQENDIFSELIKITEQDKFENFVTDARNKPDNDIRMKNDDVTLVTIKVSGDSADVNKSNGDEGLDGDKNQTGELKSKVLDEREDVKAPDEVSTEGSNKHKNQTGKSGDLHEKEIPPILGFIPLSSQITGRFLSHKSRNNVGTLKRQRALLMLLCLTLSFYIYVEENRSRREFNNLALELKTIRERIKAPERVIIEKKTIVYSDKNQENEFLLKRLSNSVPAVKREESEEWIKFEIDLYAWHEIVVENCTDCNKTEIEVTRERNIFIEPATGDEKEKIFGQLKKQSKFELLPYSDRKWFKFKFVGYREKKK